MGAIITERAGTEQAERARKKSKLVRARSSLLLLQTDDSRVHKTASEMQLREHEEMDHLLHSTTHLKQYATWHAAAAK